MSVTLYTALLLLMCPVSASADPHQHENTTLVGRWAKGPYSGLAAKDSLCFVGSGALLTIYDCADPAEPKGVGSTILPTRIHGIAIRDSLAFITTSGYGIQVVDFSDLTQPFIAGNSEVCNVGGSLLHGDYLYLISNVPVEGRILTFCIADPYNPELVHTASTQDIIMGLCISDDVLFYIDRSRGGVVMTDITSPSEPEEIGLWGIDSVTGALSCVSVSDNIMAVGDGWGVKIYDISDINNISRIGALYAHGPDKIVIRNDTLYSISSGHSPEGFYAFSIADPEHPTLISEPSENRYYNQMAIGNGVVYLSGGNDGFTILSIQDPQEQQELYCDNGCGGSIKNVRKYGSCLYALRPSGLISIFDISDMTEIEELGSMEIQFSNQSLSAFNVSGDIIYAGGTTSDLYLINMSDPTNPEIASILPLAARITDILATDPIVVITEQYIYTIDAHNPLSPEVMDSLSYLYGVGGHTAVTKDDYLFVGSHGGVFLTIDISAPSDLRLVNHHTTGTAIYDMCISGDYLYGAGGRAGIGIIDISDPVNPYLVKGMPIDSGNFRTTSIMAENGYLYVCNSASTYRGLRVFNIIQADSLVQTGYYETGDQALGLDVSEGLVYIADGGDGLYIVRNDDPLSVSEWHCNPNDLGLSLVKNYPNPFNFATTIQFQLYEDALADLFVTDSQGRKIANIVNGNFARGINTVTWTATGIPSGMYFLVVNSGNRAEYHPIVLER